MVVNFLITKIKHFVLFFVGIFRRALCCFRRRRRPSIDSVPLTHVGVISNTSDPEEWSWNEKLDYTSEPKTVQDHIELYRKRKAEHLQQEESENLDFFEDMTPKITKQTKVYIKEEQGEDRSPNRLNLIDAVPAVIGELREWEENSGWEGETLDWETQEALREKKRKDRERKLYEQQLKRQEKVNRSLGAKLST